MNHRIVYIRDENNNPVGCVAYCAATNNKRSTTEHMAYGVSFFNSEKDSLDKSVARSVAEGRLLQALSGTKRVHQQDRWGILTCVGNNIHEKTLHLLDQLKERCTLHRNPLKDAMMKRRLATQIRRMTHQKAA